MYDGSAFTADMAVQNVIGDSFRGATWAPVYNGDVVILDEPVKRGFGVFLVSSYDADRILEITGMLIMELYWKLGKE